LRNTGLRCATSLIPQPRITTWDTRFSKMPQGLPGAIAEFNGPFDGYSRWWRGLREWLRQYDFAIPRGGLLPLRRDRPCVAPRRLAGVLPLQLSCAGAGGEDMALASFPALLSLLKFAGSRLLRVSGFAFLAVPPIEIQDHTWLCAGLSGIARQNAVWAGSY
jgi:hypothetical protein